MSPEPQETVEVGFQSWAGLTWHRAEFVKILPSGRWRVRWMESFLRKQLGTTSDVNQSAIRALGAHQKEEG